MPDSEEKKSTQEQEVSSAAEESIPSLDDLTLSPEINLEEEESATSSEATASSEQPPEVSHPPQKIELKRHARAVTVPHVPTPSTPAEPTAPVPAASAPAATMAPSVSAPPQKEVAANLPPVAMEVEIDFVLDRKRIPLTDLSTLAVGEMITLSGAEFKATLFLQEKAIAEGELVMIDQRPSIQITKVFAS
jgi:flagellar motor switch/type III secretory pathway protein FliN